MIAKIKTENGIYTSIVFAINENGWNSEAIIFNQDYTALQVVKIWKVIKYIYRNVFIYNIEKSNDWVVKKDVEGYEWILDNVHDNFSKTEIDDAVVLNKCKAIQATVEECDWFELKNETDIENLMKVAFGFHDAYVKDMYIKSGKQYIHFDTTWGCEILFELDGQFKTNLIKDYGHIEIDGGYPLIFDSSLFFEENLTYWVDDDGIHNSEDMDIEECHHYFCANMVKWKLIIS